MVFNSFTHFVDQINQDLGPFCNEFQYKRKQLNGNGRTAGNNALFGNIKENKKWAINKGGGTELQYHIKISFSKEEIGYGIGFNTQYVQFASNSINMVQVMKPYMQAFLEIQTELETEFTDYNIIHGNHSELINPQEDQYVMWGKRLPLKNLNGGKFEVDETVYQEILSDQRKQFSAYVKIFKRRNEILKMEESVKKFKEILEHKYQIILQGPPGTGKTYTAKDIAEKMVFGNISPDKDKQQIKLESSERFKLVQFHPAYSYEDFVRGISAKIINGNVHYKVENRVFAAFAEKAYQNFLNSKKPVEELSKEKWLNEVFSLFVEKVDAVRFEEKKYQLNDKVEIVSVDDDAFIYGGEGWEVRNHRRMKFSDVKMEILADVQSRKDIQELSSVSGRAKQHATYDLLVVNKFREFIEDLPPFSPDSSVKEKQKSYVLIIDEINRANLPAVLGELIYALEYRGKSVESMYELEDQGNKLVLPENLFIIGTMNTADRSLGHVDYAIRRRFAFESILPSNEVIKGVVPDEDGLKDKALSLYTKIEELFSVGNIAADFKVSDVQLGHSYFLAKTEKELELKLKFEILPLLHEYLKDGILNPSVTIQSKSFETEAYLEKLKQEKWQ